MQAEGKFASCDQRLNKSFTTQSRRAKFLASPPQAVRTISLRKSRGKPSTRPETRHGTEEDEEEDD